MNNLSSGFSLLPVHTEEQADRAKKKLSSMNPEGANALQYAIVYRQLLLEIVEADKKASGKTSA